MAFNMRQFKESVFSSPLRLVYSALILFNHFAFGMNVNILGATLVDLRFIFDVEIDIISYIPVCVAVGYLLGALAGWLYKWLNRQLMLGLFILLMAGTVAVLPHYGTLAIAFPALVLNGIGAGAWDSASGFWAVEMWPIGNDAMLQLVQFMYGAGSVVAPLLAAPFVYGEKNVTEVGGENVTITAADRIHRLTLPFAIIGGNLLIVPIILLIMFVTHRYEKDKNNNSKDKNNNSKDKNNNNSTVDHKESRITKGDERGNDPTPSVSMMPFRFVKLAMGGICLATYATSELCWFGFSSALYQYLPITLDASTAAHMQSILSATFTSGRLLTAFLTLKLKPDTIIAYHYCVGFTALATLYFGQNSVYAIYAGSALLGYGYSAMYPSLMAFIERHLKLSDQVCSSYSFLMGLLSMMPALILGQISLKESPQTLFLIDGTFLTISGTMFLLLRLWIWKDGSRANGKYN